MKRVVVVADNALIGHAVRLGLRDARELEMLACVPVELAARTVVERTADVVLLDELDEPSHVVAVIQELKEIDQGLVVMLLAARPRDPWLRLALAAGADGAFAKSIRPSALGTLIRESARGHIVHAPATLAGEIRQSRGAAEPEPTCLTERELQILRLVAAGGTNGDIARDLWVAETTVKFHLRNIYRKLDLGNRTAACHYAHVHGLVAPPPESDEDQAEFLRATAP